MNDNPSAKIYLAFAAAVLIGGANFVGVRLSNEELPPLFGATLRFALAGAIFLLTTAVMRVPRPERRALGGAALYGVLGFGAAYALLYYALVGLAAGTVSVIIASSPLVTHVIAVLKGQEAVSSRSLFAGVVAIAGFVILSLDSMGGDLSPTYLTAAFLATIAVASSSVVAKQYSDIHPLNMNAYGMLSGVLLLAVGSVILGESWQLPTRPVTIAAVAWLVFFGSIGLFQLFLYVVKRWTASATIYVVAAMPIVAIALDALLLDQPITLEVVLGGTLVLAAVYLGAIKSSGQPVEPPEHGVQAG